MSLLPPILLLLLLLSSAGAPACRTPDRDDGMREEDTYDAIWINPPPEDPEDCFGGWDRTDRELARRENARLEEQPRERD